MNLLPITEKEDLKKGLKLRLIIIFLLLLIISFIFGTIMLLPSYFLALGNLSKIELTDHSFNKENESLTKEILDLPKEIDFKLKFLQSIETNISSIDIFNGILNSIPEKIIINSVSFSKNLLSLLQLNVVHFHLLIQQHFHFQQQLVQL
jgi:hypothetical protein